MRRIKRRTEVPEIKIINGVNSKHRYNRNAESDRMKSARSNIFIEDNIIEMVDSFTYPGVNTSPSGSEEPDIRRTIS